MTRIDQLKSVIAEANDRYYNSDTPIMTDAEYDALVIELEQLEENSMFSVGSKVLDSLKKTELIDKPMLSLEKVYTAEDINNFEPKEQKITCIKCDGLSTRLIYEDGSFKQAITRGDGNIGVDVTEHVKQFLNVPACIPYKGRYVVDGESIIKIKDFEEVNKDNQFKNPRNLAAGTLNSLDTKVVVDRKLSWILWDVIVGSNKETYIDRLTEAYNYGFEIVPAHLTSNADVSMINENIMDEAKKCGIPCDGVVWRINNLAYGDSLGVTSHHFKNAKAWKPQVESYETTLIDIDWTMGRTGKLTPVAIFNPIDIDGSTVNKASLHNLTIMKALLSDLAHRGQKLWIYKANLIIPQVLKSDTSCVNVEIDDTLFPPENCPICGETLVIKKDNDSEFLYCPNANCEGKLINQLDYAFGKKGFDIKGLSKATLEKLVDWGWINRLSDIFELKSHRSEWINKAGFGPKSVDNILAAIEASKTIQLDSFIASIGIPLIGKSVAKEIIKYFTSYEEFRGAIKSKYDFSQLEGFGEVKSNNILNFNYEEADKLYSYVNINKQNVITTELSSLNGITFCVTGSLKQFKNRAEIQQAIEERGGKFTTSVSSKTNYLINNDIESNSSKNIKAKSLEIPIITEETFIKKFL